MFPILVWGAAEVFFNSISSWDFWIEFYYNRSRSFRSKFFPLHLSKSHKYVALYSYNNFNWVIVIKLSKTHQGLLETACRIVPFIYLQRHISLLEMRSAFGPNYNNNIELKLHITLIQIFRYCLLQLQPVMSKFFILNMFIYLLNYLELWVASSDVCGFQLPSHDRISLWEVLWIAFSPFK